MELDRLGNAMREIRERQHRKWRGYEEEHMTQFRKALRLRAEEEHRDLQESVLSLGGYFVPEQFYYKITAMMKQVDRLFDPEVVLFIESENGGPMPLPLIDDTGVSASIVSEGVQSTTADISVGVQKLDEAPNWRSHLIKFSIELIQDSAFKIDELLATSFGIRLARGIGASFLTQLLSSAQLGITAAGSSGNTGGAETGGTSVGSDDLEGLVSSVDQAYRISPKARWLMQSSTLKTILQVKDKYGRPLFPRERNGAGESMLLGYPVAISPSMPAIGLGNKPIMFGDVGRFIVRVVKNSGRLQANNERFAEYGQVAYEMFMRTNGALAIAGSSDSPVKYLQNAAV